MTAVAHDEFLVIFNFKRDHSLMYTYMYVFGIVPLLLGAVLHCTTQFVWGISSLELILAELFKFIPCSAE